MKPDHIQFLEDNKINFETVALGYTRNIPIQDLQMYEHIYRTYLDPNFLLSVWCGNCKFEMIMRLYRWYEKQVFEIQDSQTYYDKEPVEIVLNQQPKPKRKYTKKNG